MKYMKPVLFVALVFFMVGCVRETITTEENPQALLSRTPMSSLRMQLTSGDGREYLALWRTLDPGQMHGVWIEKLTETRNMPRWNAVQIALIDVYIDTLTPDDWTVANSEAEENAYMEEALLVFTPHEIAKIFFHVYPYNENVPRGPVAGGFGGNNSDCECRYNLGCGINGICDYDLCRITNTGCGFWGGAQCKGLCDNSLF